MRVLLLQAVACAQLLQLQSALHYAFTFVLQPRGWANRRSDSCAMHGRACFDRGVVFLRDLGLQYAAMVVEQVEEELVLCQPQTNSPLKLDESLECLPARVAAEAAEEGRPLPPESSSVALRKEGSDCALDGVGRRTLVESLCKRLVTSAELCAPLFDEALLGPRSV